MTDPYESLPNRWPGSRWLEAVCARAKEKWQNLTHGDLPRWQAALDRLPRVPAMADVDRPVPALGRAAGDQEVLRQTLMELHPWRKGPLCLGGLEIDTEWRSDWKWNRVAPHVNLKDHRILDIGCGNGYFGLRMLGAGARLVVGIDPTVLFVAQWLACRHLSGEIPNFVLPLAVEELPRVPVALDTVFSMGVLYHRRNAIEHLSRIRSLLRGGGTMVLETLVLPKGREDDLLIPENRYARMRNVWAIPGSRRLLDGVRAAGFESAAIVDLTATTTGEQRPTGWMRFESLEQALDPVDRSLTVEGLPAPVRAVVIARAP